MKMPALFAAAVALSACSTTEPTGQSSERALTPLEAIDIAEVPAAEVKKIEPAKALVRTKNPVPEAFAAPDVVVAPETVATSKAVAAPEAVVAAAPKPSNDAVCNRGIFEEDRIFIICEDGKLRKANVVAALSAAHDPDLKIEEIAAAYDVPTQIFSGIQSATYGTLINGNLQVPRGGDKHKARTGVVQIQGKVYEVYQLSTNSKNGKIFVEQKFAK